MSCLAEDRFVELLDQGGLDATNPDEQAHLEACDACREAWATVAAAGEVLAEARPRSTGRAGRWIPLAAAAAMLLAIFGAIATMKTPSPVTTPEKDPLVLFLEGSTGEEVKKGREALLQSGRKALPGLAAVRPRFKGNSRYDAIQSLMWDIRIAGAKQDPDQAAIVQKLDTMRIDLSFENTRVEDILAFIRDFSGLNLVLDPTLDAGEVEKYAMKNNSLRECLEVLCAVKDLDFDLKYGVVLVSKPMRLWSTDPKIGLPDANAWTKQDLNAVDLALADKIRLMRVTVDMQNAPPTSIASYLSAIGEMATGLKSISDGPISIKASDLRLSHFLEVLTLTRGWDVRIENGAVVIFGAPK